MLYPRLLLFSVLVFASVLFAVAEQSPEEDAEHGMERVRRQGTIIITIIQSFAFDFIRGLSLIEPSATGETIELVVLNGPNSRSLPVPANESIRYTSDTIRLIDESGTVTETIRNITIFYVLVSPMESNTLSRVFIGSTGEEFSGGGILYYDEDSAFYTNVDNLNAAIMTNILSAPSPTPPPIEVLFMVTITRQGTMRVLQLTNTTNEIPTPTPTEILQITGSQSVAISNAQTVMYQADTVVVRQGAQIVSTFDNIDTFFTNTAVGGTQQLLTFQQNANNPSFFPGSGQLYVDSNRRRAFYTDDAGVIRDIENATVSQTIGFERINGILSLVNNFLVMNNEIIDLTGTSGGIDVSGATTIQVNGMDVIFQDRNGREITRATGLTEFSYYDNNQVTTLPLPGSDGTITLSGGGMLYINPDGRAFFTPSSTVNQRISTELSAATATPPNQIRTIRTVANSQGVATLIINDVPTVNLTGAQEIDVGQFQVVMYSNGRVTVAENGNVVFTQDNVNQLSVSDPPGTFEVFVTTAGRTFRGPGRLYVNGNDAFFTTDINLIQANTRFVQNIPRPSISFSSVTVDGDQSVVNLNIGGEQFLTLSNASSLSPTSGQVILYDSNTISVVDAPIMIPVGVNVTYDNSVISFTSGGSTTNISGISSLTTILGADSRNPSTTPSFPGVISGGGQLFVNLNEGIAFYTLTDVIDVTTAEFIRARGTVRNTIMNVDRLGVIDNNQFITYQGQSPRLIPGGGTIFTEGGNSFYSRDPILNMQIITAASELNPVTTTFENGRISVEYSNNTIFTFTPGSATTEIILQNFGVYTYVNGTLFNALNPNISFDDISMVVYFNGFETIIFNSSSTAVNFTGPGFLFVDTQSGTAFFTPSGNTANVIREAIRRTLDTYRRPQIDRPPITTFFTKFPSATAQFGQDVTVHAGADITLECRVLVGNPAPTISFFREGNPVPLASDGKYTISNGNLLTVNNAMLNDTGRYACEAANDVGMDRLSSDLTVLPAEAPEIVPNFLPFLPRQGQRIFVATDPAAPNARITFNTVDQLVIACKGGGKPKATIVWSINGDTDFNTTIYSVTVPRPGRSVLTVNVSDIDTVPANYSCQATNAAGMATGAVQVSGEEYDCFNSTEFTDCSATCGAGIETAVLVCSVTRDGTLTAEIDPSTVPSGLFTPQIRLCFPQECPTITYTFVNVSIGECSLPCGCGIQNITVECRELLNGEFNGTVVNDTVCIREGEDVPVRQQRCNNFDCPHWDVLSSFSACSESCNGGFRTRDVVCVNATNDVVADRECDANIMPARNVTCNEHIDCPYAWSTGSWIGCDFTDFCDVRDVTCINLDPDNFGNLLDSSLCDSNLRPHVFRSCGGGTCFRGIWSTGSFGECSVTCGVGMRTRTVTCVSRFTGVTIDNSFCAAFFLPPSSTTPCFLEPCPDGCTSEPAECSLFENRCGDFPEVAFTCCLTCPRIAPTTTVPATTVPTATIAPPASPLPQPIG